MDGRRLRLLLSALLIRMSSPSVVRSLARAASAIILVLLPSSLVKAQDLRQSAVVEQLMGTIIRETAAIKATLLKYGAAFESLVDAARDWERGNP